MARKTKHINVGFIALGCPKNIIDSEKMLAAIGQAGMVITPDPEAADVVVINTCGFIAPAREEALEAIHEAVGWKASGRVAKVIVAGCLAQRMGNELFKEVNGIDAVVGLGERDNLPDIIRRTVTGSSDRLYMKPCGRHVHDDRGRLLITPKHSSYLRISEGCNHRCAFCTIPAIRGSFRSKPAEMILSEARELIDNGAVEINIIAQDSNYYGRDLKLKNGLRRLIAEFEKLDGLEWLRLMYMYPAGVDDELIEVIASSRKVVHYIDMPIQHINDEILRSMRRTDTKDKNIALIEKLRRAMPDVSLRTTVIVGFPGETDRQFEELVEFVRWAKFDHLGCFPFFPEPDTPAAAFPDQVSDDVKARRIDALMTAQQEVAFEKTRRSIGRQLLCLVDGVDEAGAARCRHYGQAPQIDTVCLMTGCPGRPGKFVKARIVAAADYDFIVEPV
ncbi:MAG TPA: 30S ribosomal protein S12 methylthiotransferase RimO [Sedimentisphaerales bacterium]|nr:30S ribosomal protein S12 methylthiotransferase RimO [Sedimentisphaerales bacterium]